MVEVTYHQLREFFFLLFDYWNHLMSLIEAILLGLNFYWDHELHTSEASLTLFHSNLATQNRCYGLATSKPQSNVSDACLMNTLEITQLKEWLEKFFLLLVAYACSTVNDLCYQEIVVQLFHKRDKYEDISSNLIELDSILNNVEQTELI